MAVLLSAIHERSSRRRGGGTSREARAPAAVTLAVGLVLSGCGSSSSTVGDLGFENVLRIPPLAVPERDGDRLVFDLEFQAGETQFLPGDPTDLDPGGIIDGVGVESIQLRRQHR